MTGVMVYSFTTKACPSSSTTRYTRRCELMGKSSWLEKTSSVRSGTHKARRSEGRSCFNLAATSGKSCNTLTSPAFAPCSARSAARAAADAASTSARKACVSLPRFWARCKARAASSKASRASMRAACFSSKSCTSGSRLVAFCNAHSVPFSSSTYLLMSSHILDRISTCVSMQLSSARPAANSFREHLSSLRGIKAQKSSSLRMAQAAPRSFAAKSLVEAVGASGRSAASETASRAARTAESVTAMASLPWRRCSQLLSALRAACVGPDSSSPLLGGSSWKFPREAALAVASSRHPLSCAATELKLQMPSRNSTAAEATSAENSNSTSLS
mmetsp:Transcript_46298/g.147841  ORF Transcript_46298/g.147841 Transcript_46298/m.147841 type:complete len:331 (-) Transcript_46298:81-1073(-)